MQILKDGKKITRERKRALEKGIHLVSVLWVENCPQNGKHVSENFFPVAIPEQAVAPNSEGTMYSVGVAVAGKIWS